MQKTITRAAYTTFILLKYKSNERKDGTVRRFQHDESKWFLGCFGR